MQFSKIVTACSWSVLLSSVFFSQQTLAQKISGTVIKENGELLSKVKITNSVNNKLVLIIAKTMMNLLLI